MKYVMLVALFLLAVIITACGSSTGNVPRAPPQPSGGGCGVAAPSDADDASLMTAGTLEKSNTVMF